MTEKLFGTDGVRGTANVHPMTASMALRLGQAIAYTFRGRGGDQHRILIGKDTRLSGYMFEDALASGICSMGVNVIQVGPMPTPALAFLTEDMRCDAGVMISASHNPYQDNGIKFFGSDGFKLPDEVEARIEELVGSTELEEGRAGPEQIGAARRIEDAEGRYVVYLKNSFPKDLTLKGLRVVLDCANGAAYKVGPTVLYELGAEVVPMGVEPNGRNINEGVGSLYPEQLSEKVREVRADVGVALDGDADRIVMVDERGELLDGDAILAICARDMSERKSLRGNGVVSTVMSNMGLEQALAEKGLHLTRCAVGDRHVVETMRREGYNVGGEQSGHIIFLDHARTGDGLLTALQILAILVRHGGRLSELRDCFQRLPQALVNVRVAEKTPLDQLPAMQDAIRTVESQLAGKGRVLIRYSGTEPLVRIMVEGEEEARVRDYADVLAASLQRAMALRAS